MLHGDELVLHGLRLFLCLLEGGIHVGGDVEPVGVPAAGDRGNLPQFGSGGGFPGLVMAAACLETDFTLIESSRKKNGFS